MVSDQNERKFKKRNQIAMSGQLTQQQVDLLKAWSELVPTLYFLDICVVDLTKKKKEAIASERKTELFDRLKKLDQPQHGFSYLLPLLEKLSDTRSSFSDAQLEEQMLADVAAMRRFFVNATVVESDEIVSGFVKDLRRNDIEMGRPRYLQFLRAMNDELDLWNPVSAKHRLVRTKQVMEKADLCKISRWHPVVLIPIACIYRNPAAIRLMNFKGKIGEFNAENALSDIMLISRFSEAKLQIEALGQDSRFKRAELITDDEGLIGMVKCLDHKQVEQRDTKEGRESEFTFTVDLAELLTEIAKLAPQKQGGEIVENEICELAQVLALIQSGP